MENGNDFIHGGDVYTEGILKGIELLDYSSNINPLGIPLSFKDKIDEALLSVTRYPDIKYRELTKDLMQYIDCSPNLLYEYFVLGNGAAEVIDLLISCFKNVLIVVPSFAEYEINAKKWGCTIEYSCLKEDMDFNYEDILQKLKTSDALIIGNPNNPCGNIIDKESFSAILDYCEQNGKTIIIDEAFVEFTGHIDSSFIKEIDRYKCIFIIRALTKFFALPGIRFGYGISKNTDLISKIKGKQNPWNINCFAETAAKYVLKDSEYLEKSLEWIKQERNYLPGKLREIGFIEKVYDTHANFVLCKLRNLDGEKLYKLCLERGVSIRRAGNFRSLDDSYVRFAIKDRKSNERFIGVLKDIEQVI